MCVPARDGLRGLLPGALRRESIAAYASRIRARAGFESARTSKVSPCPRLCRSARHFSGESAERGSVRLTAASMIVISVRPFVMELLA
jgi:hypothetical protein